jgi:hypothetical protein
MRFSVRLAALVGALVLVPATTALAGTQVAVDTSTDSTGSTGQHATVVEPDSFGFGSTQVMAVQAGRVFDGGSNGIAFATTTNNGATGSWTSGLLPGITPSAGSGPFDRATDPAVAYDAKHDVWMVSTLGLTNTTNGPLGTAVLTSRSTNGGTTWGSPVTTAAIGKRSGGDFDKNWIACDNTISSPFYGSCYTQFDDFGNGNALKMYYSRDGGQTWTASKVPRVSVIGGQPLVLPNGNVVVPLDNGSSTALGYTVSTNGGAKFGQAFLITPISAAIDPGDIRSGPLPTAEIAGDGTIYVAWEDCRFRAGCPAAGTPNDIVYTTSTNGTTWTAVKRVPIDPVTSTVDHFLPGIAADRSTATSNALGLVYYWYADANCSTCALNVGYVSSANGGATWSNTPTTLAGPMTMSWLPDTSQGRMVGDYMSASFGSDGLVHPAYVVAASPVGRGSDCATSTPNCRQSLFTDALAASGGTQSAAADAVQFTGTVQQGRSAFTRKH